jgi:hypothetical protein
MAYVPLKETKARTSPRMVQVFRPAERQIIHSTDAIASRKKAIA